MTQPTLPTKSDGTYSGTTPANGPTVQEKSDYEAALHDVVAELWNRYTTSTSTGTDDWTKIATITFTAQGQEAKIKLSCMDVTNLSSAELDSCDVQIFARQHAAMGNNPICAIRVQNLQGDSRFGYTQFAAHFSTVDVNSSVIDIYVTAGSSGVDLNCLFRPILLDYDNDLSFFSLQATATEASITGGTFDATSQAVKGESVTGTFSTSTLTIGGTVTDTETIEHGLGTDDVDVQVQAKCDTAPIGEFEIFWRTVDDYNGRLTGSDITSITNEGPALGPSAGEVKIQSKYRASSGSSTITVSYKITALS